MRVWCGWLCAFIEWVVHRDVRTVDIGTVHKDATKLVQGNGDSINVVLISNTINKHGTILCLTSE